MYRHCTVIQPSLYISSLPVHLLSLRSDCVELINKDDGRSILLCFLEGLSQVTLALSCQLAHDLRT